MADPACVCLDTQILIWGIKGQSSPNQIDMIVRAQKFLAKLEENKTAILVPSVVLAELLEKVPVDCHQDILRRFTHYFMIAPFDTKAAKKYSEITQTKFDLVTAQQLGRDPNSNRQHLKVDRMIVATAVAHGALMIYSTDHHIHLYSDGYIHTADLPSFVEQPALFKHNEGQAVS